MYDLHLEMVRNLNNAYLHMVNYKVVKTAVKNNFSNVNNVTIMKSTFTNHPPRSPTQGVPTERDDNHDKLQFMQPQEGILMPTLQFGYTFCIGYT